MTLPEGFRWDKRWQYSKCNDALYLEGEAVATMLDKVDGGWFVLLDRHKGNGIKRDCSSYEAGKRGCELWAARHEVRLRAEVAERIASRPRHNGAGGWEMPAKK